MSRLGINTGCACSPQDAAIYAKGWPWKGAAFCVTRERDGDHMKGKRARRFWQRGSQPMPCDNRRNVS